MRLKMINNPPLSFYVLALSILAFPVILSAQTENPLPVKVNLESAGWQKSGQLIAGNNGGILTVWYDSAGTGNSLLVQGFDSRGGRHQATGALNSSNSRIIGIPGIDKNFAGTAVISWCEQTGAGPRVFYRRLEVDGTLLTSRVLPSSGQNQLPGEAPAVVSDSTGHVILAWQRREGSDYDIYGAWYAEDDSLGEMLQDSTIFRWHGQSYLLAGGTGDQTGPAMAASKSGEIVMAWKDVTQDSISVIVATFESNGKAIARYRLPVPGTVVVVDSTAAPDSTVAVDSTAAPDSTAVVDSTAASDSTGTANVLIAGDKSVTRDVSEPSVIAISSSSTSSKFLVAWVHENVQGKREIVLDRINIFPTSDPATSQHDNTQWFVGEDDNGIVLEKPVMSFDKDDRVAVTWRIENGGNYEVHGQVFNFSAGTDPSTLSTLELDGHVVPATRPIVRIEPSDTGGLLALWQSIGDGGDSDLLIQRFTVDGLVTDPLFISPTPSDVFSRNPEIAAGPDGGFTMIWEGETIGGPRIYSMNMDSRGNSLQAQPGFLNSDSWNQKKPVVAGNFAAGGVVAWEENNGSGSYRLLARALLGGKSSYGEAFTVAQQSGQYVSGLTAATDTSGNMYFSWNQLASYQSKADLMAARFSPAGQRIGSVLTVETAADGGGSLGSVAAAADGAFMVAWRKGAISGENASLLARFYSSSGSSTGTEQRLSTDVVSYLGTVSAPVCDYSDSSGYYIVAWSEFVDNYHKLYYRMFDTQGDSISLSDGVTRKELRSQSKNAVENAGTFSPVIKNEADGSFIILWVEKTPGAEARLYAVRIDAEGNNPSAIIRVPGVTMANLPALERLGVNRLVFAWQDTVGSTGRVLAQVTDFTFSSLAGTLESSISKLEVGEITVHLAGNVSDSVKVSPDGSFMFRTVINGSYELWLESEAGELDDSRRRITVSNDLPGVVSLGSIGIDNSGGTSSLPKAAPVLEQNYPNPFNPSTSISFTLPEGFSGKVSLNIYDIRGKLVQSLFDGELGEGKHTFVWSGSSSGNRVSSGVYFYRLAAEGKESIVRKMLLIK